METRKLYLARGWVATSDAVEVVNPATGEAFARVTTIDRPGVRQALADAQAAWDGWRNLTGKQRGVYMRRIAAGLDRRREVVARTITMENGKPLRESVAEVNWAIDHLEWFAEEARQPMDASCPIRPRASGISSSRARSAYRD